MTDKNKKGAEPDLKMATALGPNPEPHLKMSADLGPNTVERQAAQNCHLMNELLLESYRSGFEHEKIDCSKLKAPDGVSLEQLEKEGKSIKHGINQMRMIDTRRD